ncbi:hypothetical protein WICMUC_001785 [Wickerhamomyces mucosus]|uniref:Uncharacterized protein n=1 Tax=Wickerhamomyces mucosus TaxID=1378264 RepID=A0A9P8PTV9_9ASCO|nr:hypothetical protein WICMUC_001785 [Wickerhamomyces mucosus]
MANALLFLDFDLTFEIMISLNESKILLKSPPKANAKLTKTSKADSNNNASLSEVSISSSSGTSSSLTV